MSESADPHQHDLKVIGVIAFVHGISHFFHLILTPIFPWLVEDFGFSYSQLGLLMTAFFVVSGLGQSAAGFLVDRIGAVPVLFGALGLFALGALVLAGSQTFGMFLLGMAIAGLGNAPFHPIDFSILNSRVRQRLLGRAYAVHGMSGSLGWAFAPVFLVGLASLWGWRFALVGAAALALSGLGVAFMQRALLVGAGPDALRLARGSRGQRESVQGAATAQSGAGATESLFWLYAVAGAVAELFVLCGVFFDAGRYSEFCAGGRRQAARTGSEYSGAVPDRLHAGVCCRHGARRSVRL